MKEILDIIWRKLKDETAHKSYKNCSEEEKWPERKISVKKKKNY